MAKIYITFGQIHVHIINGRTFDKDCIAVINCENMEHGEELACDYFGLRFHNMYHELKAVNFEHYPRGSIEVNPKIENTIDPENLWERKTVIVPVLDESLQNSLNESAIGYLTKKLAFEEFKVKLIDNLTSETERAFDIFTEELRSRDILDCADEYKKFIFASLLFNLQQGDMYFDKHIEGK